MLRRRIGDAGIPYEDAQLGLIDTTPGPASATLSLDLPGRPAGGLALGTVHRFQGGERRIVLFSTVVTEPRSLGFINARVNLLNVAISRAREHLIVIGDGRNLRQGARSRILIDRAAVMRPTWAKMLASPS